MTGREQRGSGRTDVIPGIDRVDVVRARIVPVRRLTPGVAAMTFGSWILIRRDRLDDVDLVVHELVHVRQWRERGVAGFLAPYLWSYLRSRLRGHAHWEAYRRIPAEAEARSVAGR